MERGLGGGAIDTIGDGADALCAEFRAGKEGGGRLSSSSSSELSCAASVKVGTAPFAPSFGVALGVPSGDGLLLQPSLSVCGGDPTAASRGSAGCSDGLRSAGGGGLCWSKPRR